jgi:CBS domain-containing protein
VLGDNINDLLVSQDATIRETIDMLTETAQGIAFAVDGSRKLTGIVTDGDIRRAFSRGATLNTKV